MKISSSRYYKIIDNINKSIIKNINKYFFLNSILIKARGSSNFNRTIGEHCDNKNGYDLWVVY